MIFDQKKSSTITLALIVALIADITLCIWAFSSHSVASSDAPKLYFLNIGQGDSSLIELPGGAHVLIDGGPDGKKLLANLETVLPAGERYIDLLIMTHPQLDHMGGFIDVLKRYQVGAFIGNGRKAPIAAYPELISQLKNNNVPYIQLVEGDSISAGDTRLKILGPSPNNLVSGELNDTGEIVLLDDPDIRALFTADIGFNVENEIIKKYNIDVDVLKVGHHGSRFSSGENFLKATSPSVAAIEVGKNTYGHPTKDALDRLEKSGAKVTRADQDGIIQVIPTANTLQVFNLK